MRTLARQIKRRGAGRGPSRSAPVYTAHLRKYIPHSAYYVTVTQSSEVRLANFSSWVRRATDQLRADNGWTKGELATRADIGRDTIRAWANGKFTDGVPKAEAVMKFCINLGLDTLVAFEHLGWIRLPKTLPVDDGLPQPEVATELARVLRDPHVSDAEKRMMSDMIWRILAPYRRNG